MAKISELPPITGDNTRTEDLFVIVNLVQGDDGTSNITRRELVQAIQYEVFDRITITGGDISGAFIHDLRIDACSNKHCRHMILQSFVIMNSLVPISKWAKHFRE